MPQTGTLVIRVFTSRAQLPVEGATAVVSVPGEDGRQKLVAVLRTNSSGVTDPIQLEAPDPGQSRMPGVLNPFASYTLIVEQTGYYLAVFEQIQIFAGIETVQNVPLTPLPQPNPAFDGDAYPVTVTPQAL